jgi:hypothetical protein
LVFFRRGERAFFQGFLRKRVIFWWFFVVKLWWVAGGNVVFGWLFLNAEKMSLLENISVENRAGRRKTSTTCGRPGLKTLFGV